MSSSRFSSVRAHVAVGVAAALLATTGGVIVWIRQAPTAVSLDEAVAEFRGEQGRPSGDAAAPHGGTSSLAPAPGAGAAAADSTAAATSATPAPAPSGAATSERQPPAPTQASTPGVGSRWPAEGVYAYRTQGGGEIDALGGARHDYPAETPLTVRRGGCGYTVRWQPLNERWDEWEFCANGASRPMARISTYHEFFRRGIRQDFLCDPEPEMLPADHTAGSRSTWACRSQNGAVQSTTTLVGVVSLDIGGEQIRVLHQRHDVVFTGANEGSQVYEWWVDLETGLPLQMRRDLKVTSDSPFGKVNYSERFISTAISRDPRG